MKIIVGLGNPGSKYKDTRHNLGFAAIESMVERWRAEGPNKRNHGSVYQAFVGGEKVLLVKPETFMNLSGKCVGPLFGFYKIEPADLIVVHDDVDLPFLALRIKSGGGSGGHNGIKSIDESVGGDNKGYYRVKLGIGRPENVEMATSDWVLQKFANEELAEINSFMNQVVDSTELIIQGNGTEAMNKFNVKKSP